MVFWIHQTRLKITSTTTAYASDRSNDIRIKLFALRFLWIICHAGANMIFSADHPDEKDIASAGSSVGHVAGAFTRGIASL